MSSSIDQQFIEFVVKSLVNNPDDVSIERSVDEKGVLLALTVNPEDLGRVIGKRGATAQSLRTLLRALGTKNDARYNLKIVDNGEPHVPRDAASSSKPADDQGDDSHQDDNSDDAVADKAVEEALPEEPRDKEDTDHEDVISKTRKELADLDDLDV